MTTTYRADKRTAYAAGLASFANTWNGTHSDKAKIIQISRIRPATFNPPTIYVGLFSEPLIANREGVRTRMARDQLVLVQGLYDNGETADRQDPLVDAFLDWLTANPHLIPETVTEPVATEDVELAVGPTSYFATIVTVTSDIAEGRD